MFKKSELDYMTSISAIADRFGRRDLSNPEALYYFHQSIGEGVPKRDFGDKVFFDNTLEKPKKKIRRR